MSGTCPVSQLRGWGRGADRRGAYEGLVAVVTSTFADEPCGWEVRGFILEGEMTRMPEPIALTSQ